MSEPVQTAVQGQPLPPEQDLATRLWQELTRAPHDRHHDWRTPTLATQGLGNSGPQVRTVVLRQADAALWTLRVYTDARSPKCAQLRAQPMAQLLFWSKRLNWQLRLSATATVAHDGPQVEAAWSSIQATHAASDYLSLHAPGQLAVPTHEAPAMTNPTDGRHHLAILHFQVTSMDWLALRKDGHQRARLFPSGGVEWLVP